MLKDHPKGLIVAFFANMGERFGFYTMYAIFVLFIQAKYGFDAADTSMFWGIFLGAVYFFPLIGGFLADRFLGYGKSISLGLIILFIGYTLLAIPTSMDGGLTLIISGLAVITIGTGLFKGNLQALVGNLYDEAKFSKNRDVAFNIFYMGINIGAVFAPTAAEAISNWVLKSKGFFYDAAIPAMAHKLLGGDTSVTSSLTASMDSQLQFGASVNQTNSFDSLTAFSNSYINAIGESYHYAFGIASISLIVSMAIFWAFRKYYRHADLTERQKAKSAEYRDKMIELSPKETRNRFVALGMVFLVVIFFWLAFHQNSVGLNFFARDYTVNSVGKYTNVFFNLFTLLSILFFFIGVFYAAKKGSSTKARIIGAIVGLVFGGFLFYKTYTFGDTNPITPPKFHQFNSFFIVAFTPLIVAFFTWLRAKGVEPSAPKKIGLGMLITGIGLLVMVVASVSLIGFSPKEINELRAPQDVLVSPYWLISTYFVFTIAELFLSPMGISFVSKVSPPKYKGLMQGGWFAATAIGNYALGYFAIFWSSIPLWAYWSILVVFCILSSVFIFSVLRRLEAVSR
ncbi:MAG: peptide MFS transporter [Hyphomicrobiales bacterium]